MKFFLLSSYAGTHATLKSTPTGRDMTRLPNRRLLALALAAGLAMPALALAAEPFTASDIRVDGLQRISAGTVLRARRIARSASAVIVKLGFTPRLAGTAEPSTTYSPG